ncbi:Naphthalene 1,2-dioxygenase system ferredoxin subunit [Hartmannibacter diazotrophicus]|uniref:Naphthalene 1,2-dioxygenase system ferredoxin subunit n=2 Tax=Hartmannibacter diazotrophicus TaxID=1482074 RepID=A0A2C9D9E5_9HYPH|nr:Naphthalene 1,2-dioxygenase system ferredoxin subunit [Hartmannibacter diazotrophicus]
MMISIMTNSTDHEPPTDWTKVASLADFPPGGVLRVLLEGHAVVLLRTEKGIHAAQGSCPHERADLGQGRIEDCHLVCPRHLAKFDLETGAPSAGWVVAPLKLYPARSVEGTIEIDMAAVRSNPPMGHKTVWDLSSG